MKRLLVHSTACTCLACGVALVALNLPLLLWGMGSGLVVGGVVLGGIGGVVWRLR